MRTTDAQTGERAGRSRGSLTTSARGTAWRPLSGPALLQRLRETGRPRPAADPAFAADLRGLLESGLRDLSEVGNAADSGRLVVTKDRLTGALACPVHRTVDRFGERSFSIPLACGALVDALFRQIVTVGTVGDPLADALDGLGMEEHQTALVTWIGDLALSDLAELRSEVDRQVHGLAQRWPALESSWLPRTQESMRASLSGGMIELSARVDLAIGQPADIESSVAIVEVKSGARRPAHRDDLRFYALIEALRSPAPPFAVATYYSRTGEVDVESVTHEMLVEAARRCLVGTRALVGVPSDADDGAWCTACAVLPRAPVVTVATGAGDATVVDFPRGQAA